MTISLYWRTPALSCAVNALMVGARYDRDCGVLWAARSIDTTSAAVAAMAAELLLAAAVRSRISSAGSMLPRSMTPSSEKKPRSEAPSADIAGRAAELGGGSRRLLAGRCAGSGSARSQR